MNLFKKQYTNLEFVLLFITACLIGIVAMMAYSQSELYNVMIGVMSHYGEALEKLIEYEPNNEYWKDQLQGVNDWFEMLRTTK